MIEVLLAILNAVGIEPILKLIASTNDKEKVQAILDAEYAAAEQTALELEKAKFG